MSSGGARAASHCVQVGGAPGAEAAAEEGAPVYKQMQEELVE